MLENIDPDIARARTIDTSFYTDQNYYNQSREKIFANTWQFVGDTDQLPGPGFVNPFTLLPGFLSEPLLMSRDKNGAIHCMSNVCTHRGNLLVNVPCKLSQLTCKYHGRRFSLEGKFLSMPEFQEVKNFPGPADDLPPVQLHQWSKLLFVSLDPVAAADDFFREVRERMSWYPFDKLHLSESHSNHYKVKANWALYCENYLEGFHIPFVHADLNQVLDFSSYTTELFRFSNLQVGYAKEGEPCFDLPPESPDYGKRIAAYYFWVFPNLMLNFYPSGLSINAVRPTAIHETDVLFMQYMLDETRISGANADLHKVELEDEEIVENVQRGVRSRYYNYGRYSATREKGTHHFHSLITEFMNK